MLAQSPVRQDVSERVFGLDKRAAAADEVSSGKAAADDTVAAGWLGTGCGAHSVRALRQLHSSLMREHCLRCSTLPPICHGKRSHAIVTQCVRVRVCKTPRRGKEETGWCFFVPTNMSPLLQNIPMLTKSKDQKCTRKILCA